MILYLSGASRFPKMNTLILKITKQSRCLSYLEFKQSKPEVVRVINLIRELKNEKVG